MFFLVSVVLIDLSFSALQVQVLGSGFGIWALHFGCKKTHLNLNAGPVNDVRRTEKPVRNFLLIQGNRVLNLPRKAAVAGFLESLV